MLATMNPSQHDIPLREHSHLNFQRDGREAVSDNIGLEDRLCPGCKLSAVNQNGGLVVAFGQSFFHVDCFKCAKCHNQVTADTNLLLLSDGSPICANCSYSCSICNLPILDEAIMTGDDSYHAHCFKCKVCKTRIDELVFAKTSQGIYCMNCHNERMIKIRKHTQKKAERERLAGGSGSANSRERAARNHHRENGADTESQERPGSSKSHGSHAPNGHADVSRPGSSRGPDTHTAGRSQARRRSGPYVSDAFDQSTSSSNGMPYPSQGKTQASSPLAPSFPVSVTVAPPSDSIPSPLETSRSGSHSSRRALSGDHERPNMTKTNTLPIPPVAIETDPDERRRNYDDGVRPPNILFGQKSVPGSDPDRQATLAQSASASSVTEGLSVTSRRDKRRSIIPGLILSNPGSSTSPSVLSPAFSPHSASFQQSTSRSQTPSSLGGRDSPRSASPFQQLSSSRPSSHSSSTHSISSPRSSSSASPVPHENGRWREPTTILRSRSPSYSSYVPDQDQTIVMRPLPRPSMNSDEVPLPRTQSPINTHFDDTRNPSGPPSRTSLGPTDAAGIRHQRSFDDRHLAGSRSRSRSGGQRLSSAPSSDFDRRRSASKSRPSSPGHRVDVPHSVESGTDTEEDESNIRRSLEHEDIPPILPPKEKDVLMRRHVDTLSPTSDADPDASIVSQADSGSDDMSESSPVERTSHATYIAPALPPIRFSMNTADFSELFSSVGGVPSLKSLEHLARLSEQFVEGNGVPSTPPPTRLTNSDRNSLTPTSDITIIGTSPLSQSDTIPKPDVNDRKRNSRASEDKQWKAHGAVFSRPSISNDSESYDSSRAPVPSSSSSSFSDHQTLQGSHSDTLSEPDSTRITLTEPGSTVATSLGSETTEVVMMRLQEAMSDARDRGAQQLKLDRGFVEAIAASLESQKAEFSGLKSKFDGIKRTSKQYIDGLTVAQTEYDRELKARRDAEAEVTRLRVLLSGQAARLTALSGDTRQQEVRQQRVKELNENLTALEADLSKLKAERDMTLAEVEELSANKNSAPDVPSANLSRSLTMRLDNIKTQYQRELVSLTQQRETLAREITELQAIRDMFLEETTVLNARNEELAQLSAVYARRVDSVPEISYSNSDVSMRGSLDKTRSQAQHQQTPLQSLSSSTTSSITIHEDTADSRYHKVQKAESEAHTPLKGKFMKWPGSKAKEVFSSSTSSTKARLEHNFQQLSILRFTRCDHCGDKMWGSQLRCTVCSTSVHVRCISHVHSACTQQSGGGRDENSQVPLPPSMFGRDLTEQVRADSQGNERQVPIIVEKCIEAVEDRALEYEGIYRKSGGSGQTKQITQLFERGDYSSFDLRDSDRFNDICSVTSVLKTYFRSLPIPLLTYDLHDDFMTAIQTRDLNVKNKTLQDLISKLPNEHYYTLRMLMLHLHHVRERSEKNLMNARNLGVVFGPTLCRSQDPGAEFSDMAGKALFVEWLVDYAPSIFNSN